MPLHIHDSITLILLPARTFATTYTEKHAYAIWTLQAFSFRTGVSYSFRSLWEAVVS